MKTVRRLVAPLTLAAWALAAGRLAAATVFLTPSADTTLIENSPANNMGAQLYFNAGSTGLTPPTRNRGLFSFDIRAAIPPGAKIQSATLILNVVREPANGFTPAPFALRKVLKPWGEGAKPENLDTAPGAGAPATAGEATWRDRFAFQGAAWASPGGKEAEDFAKDNSAELYIYGTGDSPYLFPSTPRVVADVQAWLDRPDLNFGWMLLCLAEKEPYTARRLGSREDPNNAPLFEVHFLVEPKIVSVATSAGGVSFEFAAAEQQTYEVQRSDNLLAGSWQTVLRFAASPAGTVLKATDTSGTGQGFYRVVTFEDNP